MINWNEVWNRLDANDVASTYQIDYRNHFNELRDVEDMVNEGLFQEGDIITVGNDTYVYRDSSFQLLRPAMQSRTFQGTMMEWHSLSAEEKSQYDLITITDAMEHSEEGELIERKCRSCGAPLMVSKHSTSVKCEYCGSMYSY